LRISNIIDTSDKRFKVTHDLVLYFLPLLAIIGVTISIALRQYNYTILGTYMAIPMLLAPLIYLARRRNRSVGAESRISILRPLMSIYFLLFSLSVIILNTFEVRPFIYYITITIMSVVLLIEILLSELSNLAVFVILIQIMMLILNIIWGVTLNYYYFIGSTDVIVHLNLIKNIIDHGFIGSAFGVYQPFPLWHVEISSLYIILNQSYLAPNKIMFFVGGITYAFVIPFSYLVAREIFKNKRLSLLSSLFIAIYPDTLYYGMYSIPRSVDSFLEIILILLIIKRNDARWTSLLIFLTFITILYHTISIAFILLIFCIIYLLQLIYLLDYDERIRMTNYLVYSICLTLGYWIYNAQMLFGQLVSNVIESAPTGVVTKSIINTPVEEVFNYLQYSILLFFLICGFLLLTAVAIPGPALLLNKLSANFQLFRFAEYSFLFIGLTSAIGFHENYCRSKGIIRIIIIILFAMGTILAISNEFTASDNPLVKRPFFTFYLTEGELDAFESIDNITTGYLMSDFVTNIYIANIPHVSIPIILEVDKRNMRFVRNTSKDVFLIRDQELSKRPLKLYSSKTGIFTPHPSTDFPDDTEYYYKGTDLFDKIEAYNNIYKSGVVSAFD
jgi:hypothetical protein